MRELFARNPMMIDFIRGMRRFFNVGKNGKLSRGMVATAIILYLLIVLITTTVNEYSRPVAFCLLAMFVLSVVVPAVGHGAIVGERERRSWDFILIAPITDAQIVVGKFLSMVCMAGIVVGLFLPLMLISFRAESDARDTVVKFLGQFVLTLGWGALLCAMTIFVSARAKRSLAANMMLYGGQFVWLLVLPNFLKTLYGSALIGVAPFLSNFFDFFNPFASAAMIQDRQDIFDRLTSYGDPTGAVAGGARIVVEHYGLLQFVVYLAISAVLVLYTVRSLRVIDRKESLN